MNPGLVRFLHATTADSLKPAARDEAARLFFFVAGYPDLPASVLLSAARAPTAEAAAAILAPAIAAESEAIERIRRDAAIVCAAAAFVVDIEASYQRGAGPECPACSGLWPEHERGCALAHLARALTGDISPLSLEPAS